MAESLHILQVCPCYVDMEGEGGGVANIVKEMVQGLIASGHRVTLVCGNHEVGRKKSDARTERSGDKLNLHVVAQHPHPLLGPTRELKRRLRTMPQPDVAHVHTCFSAFSEAAMKTLAQRGVPYVFTPHGKLAPDMLEQGRLAKAAWWRLHAHRAVRAAGRIVVSAANESRGFAHLGLPPDPPAIPNGYRMPQGLCRPAGTYVDNDGPLVLFLGSISARKQPELVVDAFARSRTARTGRLVIAGPDRDGHTNAVRRRIEALGSTHRVQLVGPVYGPEKFALLKSADVLCLPSRGEGLPVTLCEALGCATPIVMSRDCNFHEAAAAGAAVEIRGFSEAAWADAIDKVCLNSAMHARMQERARTLAIDYTWEAVVDRWIGVYGELGQG